MKSKVHFIMIVALAMLIATAIAQATEKQSLAQQTNNTSSQTLRQNNTSVQSASQQANQTILVSQGNKTTVTVNSTLIPLQITTIDIRTITKSVDSKLISEFQNLTVSAGAEQSRAVDLSKIQNQTVISPTGKAYSTIITRTVTPYNVTTLQLIATLGQNQTFVTTTSPDAIEQLFKITQPSLEQQISTNNNLTAGTQRTQNNTSPSAP
jgi:hypothetical protein